MNKPTRRPPDDVPWQKPADLSPEDAAALFNQMEVPKTEPPRLPRRLPAAVTPPRKFATHYEGMSLALGAFFLSVVLASLAYVLMQTATTDGTGAFARVLLVFSWLIGGIAPIIIICKLCLTVARTTDLLEEIASQNRKD